MKKILIFGVNGYLGGLSAVALNKQGCKIDGIGTTKQVDPNLRSIVDNYIQIKSRISELDLMLSDYNCIMFCISLDHNKSEKDFRNTLDINCGILADLVHALKIKSIPTPIVYLSTMQVYKDQKFELNITEPNNIYGYTHLACEQLLKLHSNAVVLRLSNVYGPPQTRRANIEWTLVADLCKSIAQNNLIQIRNDGTAVRNFLFSEDFQDLLLNLLSNQINGYFIYDVIGKVTSTVGSIKRILETIAMENGKKISIKTPENYKINSEEQLINVLSSLKNFSKKKYLIGETELFKGLKKTIKYYEEV